METPELHATPFEAFAHDTIPIASLDHKTSIPSGKHIKAIVSLIWPFSSSSQTTAILAVEPDFRLRTKKGQVRIQFRGPAAKAIAMSGMSNGDAIILRLDGASFAENAGAAIVQTPGRSVDVELVFAFKLALQIQRNAEALESIDVDEPFSNSSLLAVTPSRPMAPPTLTPQKSPIARSSPNEMWSSPAFATPLRLPAVMHRSLLGEASSSDDFPQGRDPKRAKLWNRSVDWHLDASTIFDDIPKETGQGTTMMPLSSSQSSLTQQTTAFGKKFVDTTPLEVPKAPISPHLLPIQSAGLPLVSPFPNSPDLAEYFPFHVEPIQDAPEIVPNFFPFDEFVAKTPPFVADVDEHDLYTASPRLNVENLQTTHDIPSVILPEASQRNVDYTPLAPDSFEEEQSNLPAAVVLSDDGLEQAVQKSKSPLETHGLPAVLHISEEVSPIMEQNFTAEVFESDHSHHFSIDAQSDQMSDEKVVGSSSTHIMNYVPNDQTQTHASPASHPRDFSDEQSSHLNWLEDGYSGSNLIPPTPQASQITMDAFADSELASHQSTQHHIFEMPPTPLLTQEPSKASIIDIEAISSKPSERAVLIDQADETPKRRSGGRTSNVPDVISPWFSAKAKHRNVVSVRQHEKLDRDPLEKDLKRSNLDEDPETDERHATPQKNGLRTDFSYYTPLLALESYLNSPKSPSGSVTIDVFVVSNEDAEPPTRATKGPRDYFVSLDVVDMSLFSSTVQVLIFRPWSKSLPDVSKGDVILLRNFVVQTAKPNRIFLLSAESSAWCVWRFDKERNEVNKPIWATEMGARVEEDCRGPPVELGETERRHARVLASWWKRLPPGDLADSREVEVLQKTIELPLTHVSDNLGPQEVSVN